MNLKKKCHICWDETSSLTQKEVSRRLKLGMLRTFTSPLFHHPHPEAKVGEIYLMNIPFEELSTVPWKVRRLGIIPLNIYSEQVSSDEKIFPLFLNKQELEIAGYWIIEAPFKANKRSL